MDSCLLCLEINNEFEDCIKADSLQWLELNIQSIIEKHFWSMEILNGFSTLCAKCWQELYDFHKFYKRIEVAHINIGKFMKVEDETLVLIDEKHDNFIKELDINTHKYKKLFDTNLKNNQELEPEVLIIKEENLLGDIVTEHEHGGKPLNQRRKRQCTAKKEQHHKEYKNNDPLKKVTKKSKTFKSKIKETQMQLKKSVNDPITIIKSEEVDKVIPIKAELLGISEDEDIATSENGETYTNDGNNDDETNSHTDQEESNKNSTTKSKTICHKNDKFISENIQLYCHLCQIQFENFTPLLKHFKVAHKQRGYAVCCQKKFIHRSDLVDHIYVHRNPEHFKCKFCEKALSDRKCLKVHIKKLHEGIKYTQKNFDCEICGKVLANKHGLKIHTYTMHEVTKDDRETCTECDRTFRNKLSLKSHIKSVHLKKYAKICDLCGITISDKEQFKRHMLKHEGKPLPTIACNICGRIYTEKKSLRRHINLTHPKEKVEFSCDLCSKKFASKYIVQQHIKSVHESSYVQKCTVCEKTFRRPDALRDHMSRHNGTPLHSCPWCPKTFYSNGQMHAHRKELHPKEWEEYIREKHSGNLPEKYKLPVAMQVNTFALTL